MTIEEAVKELIPQNLKATEIETAVLKLYKEKNGYPAEITNGDLRFIILKELSEHVLYKLLG